MRLRLAKVPGIFHTFLNVLEHVFSYQVSRPRGCIFLISGIGRDWSGFPGFRDWSGFPGTPRDWSGFPGMFRTQASECLPGRNSFRASQAVCQRFPACPAPCFYNNKITHFLKRPFEPDFCDYDPILDPKMASPDRLLALFFRLPASLNEFSKK